MAQNLSFTLHVLTARLDRAADRLLRVKHDISYRRFLALTLVGTLGASTQRALADGLGVTEPSVSRMVGVLSGAGLLEVDASPAGGRQRQLRLSAEGEQLVNVAQDTLERRFSELVRVSGVPYDDFAAYARRLVAALDQGQDERWSA